MKTRIFSLIAVLLAALSISCGTTSSYGGPVADKVVVTTDVKSHVLDVDPTQPPKVERITTLNISNPNDKRTMHVLVDCEVNHQAGFQGLPPEGGTREHLTIAPRTTQHVLLASTDGVCLVSEE